MSCSLSVAGHFPAGTLGSCLTELTRKSVQIDTKDQTETEKDAREATRAQISAGHIAP